MAKRVTTFELALPSRGKGTPAYRWLYAAVRSEILEGRLRPGARLPATRDLANQYTLARGTIVNAFELLKAEGYLEGAIGSGTFVSKVLPEDLIHIPPSAIASPTRGKRSRSLHWSRYGSHVKLFPAVENLPIRAFRCHLPAVDLFPTEVWARLMSRCAHRVSRNLLMGCEALGHLPLRSAIAEYLGLSRGVKCTAEQVAVVSGVQEALDLTARLFVDPGEVVCMEDPGYPGAALVFHALGAKIAATCLDAEGLRVRDLPRQGIRLVYVTPGHQFPLGTTMSLARRLQLLNWARHSGALIFEDDYDGEYRYSERPVPALHGLDRHGMVLYAGSFSKVLFPALRMGYLVIPADLVGRFEAAKSLTSRHAPLSDQVVLTEFIREGHFGRHLRRMREVYAERLSVLREEAEAKLGGLLRVSNVGAGLQTTGWLEHGMRASSVAAAAAKRNVEVIPLNRYRYQRALPEGLHLGFAAVDTKEIRRGVRELAFALESESRKHPRGAYSRQN
jgi:GntR family transcriptional regulator/MocR family aminotransferase